MNDYICHDCGHAFDAPDDFEKRMEYLCPSCGSSKWGLKRQECHVGFTGLATDWSRENNGKGRRISQLDYGVRQPYYAKSQQAAIDEAHRRGLNAHKA